MKKQIILTHFQRHDPIIAKIIERYGFRELTPTSDYFVDLAETIVGQQLSNKAADSIWKKFTSLFAGGIVTPDVVVSKQIIELRKSGISNSKAQYIKNIAHAFQNGQLLTDRFKDMDNETIRSQLTAIKGIGNWTAEMFLIFSLARTDIFSLGDGGLSRALQIHYGKGKPLDIKKIEKIIAPWSPYKSYACLALWKSLDNQ